MKKTSHNKGNATRTPDLSEQAKEYLKTEYIELRAELVKRIELQHQLLSLALIAFGTFLTVGIQGVSAVSLAYPPLAMFLAIGWSQSDIRIRQIHLYIKKYTEELLLNGTLGWEHTKRSSSISKFGSLSFLSSRGILMGTQLLAVIVALFRSSLQFQLADYILLGVDGFAVLFTFFIMGFHKVNID